MPNTALLAGLSICSRLTNVTTVVSFDKVNIKSKS
jgi:hypothetical protein